MSANEPSENSKEQIPNDGDKISNSPDELFYFENGLMVFTEAYHLKRGDCCGDGCRHCPFGHEKVKK